MNMNLPAVVTPLSIHQNIMFSQSEYTAFGNKSLYFIKYLNQMILHGEYEGLFGIFTMLKPFGVEIVKISKTDGVFSSTST